ncbi:MAG: NAD(P)/FAD-dependent oxidoreductase, partial [Chitinophagales bacterium]
MRVIIVGNGAAGNQAAQTLRVKDAEAEITILGQEEMNFYSACALPDYLAGWIPRQQLFIKDHSCYERENISLHLGCRVNDIDPLKNELWVDGHIWRYDQLILATGSRPLLPPVPGSSLPGNFVVKTVADIDQILLRQPRKVVVVGSGNIGVEVAEALEIRGCEVSIVEMQDRIMPRLLDRYPSSMARSILERHGVTIYTEEKSLEVKGVNDIEALVTNKRVLDCDTVIWAAGVKQNTELAALAGLKIGSLGGIVVNTYMQTSRENIWACGDCIECQDLLTGKPVLSLLWPSAKAQGYVAALNCLGLKTEYPGAFNVIVEELYGLPIAAAGLREDDLAPDHQVREVEYRGGYYRFLIQNNHLVGIQSIGSLDGLGPL